MKSAGKKSAVKRKSRAVIDWKKTNEEVSLAIYLSAVREFFLSAEGGDRSVDESGFKSI